ncbi:hypothetical protein ACOKGD_08760 [Microbacterium phosphatis]|uniref:hypothetical protein n=1 Tax=Microbacterium phosphatis TaxID=3140248 RepID=UPI003140A98B
MLLESVFLPGLGAFAAAHLVFDELIPDPWRGLAIMALYGAGQGLIAAGVLGRLAVRVSATPPVGVSASVARG